MEGDDASREARLSLRSRLMEDKHFLEMPPPLSPTSDDRLDDETQPTNTDEDSPHATSTAAEEQEETVDRLGHGFHLLTLEQDTPTDVTTMRAKHSPIEHLDCRLSNLHESFDDRTVTEDDASMFRSVMLSIKDGIDPRIGSLQPHDITCLDHDLLLNDEIINAFMQLLQKHETHFRCHFFNSFFLPRLISGYDYPSIKNWTSSKRLMRWGQCRDSILDVDRIFFPYFAFVHWSLVVVDLKMDTVTLYDSIPPVSKRPRGHVKKAMDCIVRYLIDEAEDKKSQNWSDRSFSFCTASNVPLQENESDCGVFLVQFAKRLSTNVSLSFGQRHIYDYRIQMLKELQHNRIL